MKTGLFLVAGSLALLVSCSKDNQPETLNGNLYQGAESLFTRMTEVSGDIDPEHMLKLNCEWNVQTAKMLSIYFFFVVSASSHSKMKPG